MIINIQDVPKQIYHFQGTVKGMFSHLFMSELTVMFMIVILFVDLPAGLVVFVVHLLSLT